MEIKSEPEDGLNYFLEENQGSSHIEVEEGNMEDNNQSGDETDDPDIEDTKRQCKFCRKILDVTSYLPHIANKEECRIFYGSRLEDLKKKHKSQRSKNETIVIL